MTKENCRVVCCDFIFVKKPKKAKKQLRVCIFVLSWRNVWKDIHQAINMDYLRAMATISLQFDLLQRTCIAFVSFKIYIVRWGGFGSGN